MRAMRSGLSHGSDLTYKIIGLAMRVHSQVGPGLLESVYETCLCHELRHNSIAHECQGPIPVNYDGTELECGYRADIIVAGEVILEIKSIDHLGAPHEAQLLTYLRLSGCRIGLLIIFNTVSLTDGIRRCVA
jgi:GxxExxY protein